MVLYVDCKHSSHDRATVSNQDVDAFIVAFQSRRQTNGWTAGVLVSNRPFGQYARAAAKQHHDIYLKTLDDLYEDVLRTRSYLHRSVEDYERTKAFWDYIPLYATDEEADADRSSDLNRLVQRWLSSRGMRQLCLLGDFGTGKTTFLKHLHYRMAKSFIATETSIVPLYIPLRDYSSCQDAKDMIQRFFSSECGAIVPYRIFEGLLESGRYLLLLDGFDEMAYTTSIMRQAQYIKLSPLAKGHSKVIISCRPSYFIERQELRNVFKAIRVRIGISRGPRRSAQAQSESTKRVMAVVRSTGAVADIEPFYTSAREALEHTKYLMLELFNERQIREYLERYEEIIVASSRGQLNANSMLRRIKEIYDLDDLSRRPILLKLLVTTLPQFSSRAEGYAVAIGAREDVFREITPCVLYHVYTELELKRDAERTVHGSIDKEEKRALICAIAHVMYSKQAVVLERDELARLIQSRHSVEDDVRLAELVTELRSCSFLTCDNLGSVRFTHKSFLEYFVALYLVRDNMTSIGQLNKKDDRPPRGLEDSLHQTMIDRFPIGRLGSKRYTLAEVRSLLRRN